jgi:hypothetical protein
MMGDGLAVPRHDAWRGTPFHIPSHVSRHPPLQATWQLDPATMHGGVQFNCPAMYGDGAKRTSFENILK